MSAKRRTRVEPGIYRRPDGKLEIGYRDAHGRQRWQRVDGGIISARKALTAAKAKRDRGEAVSANPRLTFGVAADAWLAARVARLTENTRLTYGKHVEHLRDEFGHSRFPAITAHEVTRYIAKLDREGASGWTQRGRLSVLSAVFGYARERLDYPGANPVSRLTKGEKPRVDDQRAKRILTGSEVEAILAAVNPEHRVLLATAIQTGARKGEVLGLTWGDVNVPERTIRIERQLDRHGARVALKTDRSERIVAIPSGLAAQLAEHRLARGRPDDAALVFTRRAGTPYTHSAADEALATAIRRAGIEHLSWHDLRHTHVSLLIASGRDLVSIAARIGDTEQTVLSTYAHEFDAARRRAEETDALDAIYGSVMEAADDHKAQQTNPAAVANLALARENRT